MGISEVSDHERRAEPRVDAVRTTLGWHPSAQATHTSESSSPDTDLTAEVANLSLGGAKVNVAHPQVLPIGARVGISMGGGRGTAEVRRVTAGPPGTWCYGIHFLEIDQHLREAMRRLMAGEHGHIAETWRSSPEADPDLLQ
jgi:3D (Asp-Asp-Asp) domain-containing protein